MRFSELAKMKPADVKRPPLAPPGHYIFRINKPFNTTEKSSDKGHFDFVDFPSQSVQALDDVDPAMLAEAGGPTAINISKRFIFNTAEEERVQAERTGADLKTFLEEHCKVKGATVMEMCAAAVGSHYIAEISHRIDPDNPDRVYYDMKRTMPVE